MAKQSKKKLDKASVILEAKGSYDKQQVFEMQHALKLLKLPNTQWKLNDKRYIFENNDIRRNTSEGENS